MVGVGFLAAVDLFRIRADLTDGQSRLAALSPESAGSSSALTAATGAARASIHRAAERSRSSPWLGLLHAVPVARTQIDAVRDLSGAASTVADLADDAARTLAPAIDQARAEPSARVELLDDALAQLDVIDEGLAGIDPGGRGFLLPPLSGLRSQFVDKLAEARTSLTDARRSTAALRRFLAGPADHLILAANQAEMTAGSGMPLSAGVAHVEDGDVEVGDFTPTSDLYLGDRGVQAPGDLARLYAPMGMGRDFRGTTASPNFPTVAPMLQQMAAHSALGPVDSVFVVDAVVLRKIVALTGPVTVDGVEYDATNLEAEVLNGNYLRYSTLDERDQRTELQSRIARAVFDAMQTRHVDIAALVTSLRDAASGRHFLAWSPDPELEDLWMRAGASGALAPDGLLISPENYDGNKLDYYLRPVAALDSATDGDGSTRERLEVTIANPPRHPTSPVVEGEDPTTHWVFLDVHLPAMAYDVGHTTTGLRQSDTGYDGAKPVVTMIYSVPLGASRTVTISFSLPRGQRTITLLPSARVHPIAVATSIAMIDDRVPATLELPGPGWWVTTGREAVPIVLLLTAALAFALSGRRARARTGAASVADPADGATIRVRVARARFDERAAIVLAALAFTMAVAFSRGW